MGTTSLPSQHLHIEKLVYGGEGIARMPRDEEGRAKTVFIPFVLPGERVEARVLEEKKDFARAQVQRVIAASEKRSDPACPYFTNCGGCQYQHAAYAAQLQFKSEILRETLERTAQLHYRGEIKVHPSPPFEYRNRTRLHIQNVPEFRLGYFRYGSRDLLSVERCPISSPLINRALAAMWELGRRGIFPRELVEIEFFVNDSDDQLLLELYLTGKTNALQLKRFSMQLSGHLKQLAGVSSFLHQRAKGNGFGQGSEVIHGAAAIPYRSKLAEYNVSAGSFFQTNRFLVDTLVEIVVGGRHGGLALDLYAGVGLFSVPLAKAFQQVVAVESAPISGRDLEHNATANIKVVRQTTEKYLESPGSRLQADLVVVDPPRFGLGERVTRLLSSLAADRIIYVSCDPATLARDLKVMTAGGWRVEELNLIDLFPQTFHIETIAVLER